MEIGTLYEAHLVVRDLTKSAQFYEGTLGFQPALATSDVRFYWTGNGRNRMFALWQLKGADVTTGKHTSPDVSKWVRTHIAFQVPPDQLWTKIDRLRERGVEVRGFEDESTEPSVHCWVPAVSAYFSDPDGHALELISVLDATPDMDHGILPWSTWKESHS